MMKRLLLQSKLFRLLFWLWGLTVVVLSSLPNIPTQQINVWDEPWRLDYLEHFGVFTILAMFFVLWKIPAHGQFPYKRLFLFILLIILFAAADEIHQIWIPGRAYNPLDLIYNIAGLITGFLITPPIFKKIVNT